MVRLLISHWEKLLTLPWVKVAWWTFPSWLVVHLAFRQAAIPTDTLWLKLVTLEPRGSEKV
jgi:hypothetical protein